MVAAVVAMLASRPRLVPIQLGDARIAVAVADTAASREQGLSGTATLSKDHGMLFVFQSDDKWDFWMKDMHYSLDIIWLDANKKVVSITPHATPNSYPHTVFSPDKPARYVLEVNAGLAEKSNITVGEMATFTLP